jgi:hypothetical protein
LPRFSFIQATIAAYFSLLHHGFPHLSRPVSAHVILLTTDTMNILLFTKTSPVSFKHLAPALAADPANRVVAMTRKR